MTLKLKNSYIFYILQIKRFFLVILNLQLEN